MKLFGRSKEQIRQVPPEELIESTPMERLAVEVDRLRLIQGNERSRMHMQYMLYVPSDPQIPYVQDGLAENEILISNAMGEVEYYRYRLIEGGTVVNVYEKNGTELLMAIDDDSASRLAGALAGFGQEFADAA